MTKLTSCLFLSAAAFVPVAAAHVYLLQYTPNSGARGLVVAGYQLSGNTVIGNCSYYTVHSASGKGGGYHTTTTYYNQTCAWDFYGNLLSVVAGAPVAPAPLYTIGTQTIYASNANGVTTGTDTTLPQHGFVNTPGSHYTWTTSNAYQVLQSKVYSFSITLLSDGDLPLTVAASEASAIRAKVAMSSTTCTGAIPVGATCSITVTYDPTRLRSTTRLAYDTLTVGVISDAGQIHDFVQTYTINVPVPVDD
jgi:hypothetical protein